MSNTTEKQGAHTYDTALLFPVLLLVGIGIVMVYSASSALALKKFNSDYYFVKKQMLFALVGIIALVSSRHFPYRWLRPTAYILLLASVVLLIAVQLSPLAHTAGGAQRWLRFMGISFQPSEFARFALVVYLAYSLSKKQEKIQEFSIGFLPHVIVLAFLSGLIMLQPDFGSVVILSLLTWIMMFVGGVRLAHLLPGIVVLIPVVYGVLISSEYRLKRIMTYLNPWQYPANEGYQIVHSQMAFGTGGLWGTGIGQGYQKLFYLPEPHTDFIFSVIGEELGLWGVILILALYVTLFWRGLSIALKTTDIFGAFLAMGLTVAVGLQVFINMGVALGLLPTKGLALPFLSYGGTSLVMNMAGIGVLMNIEANQTP